MFEIGDKVIKKDGDSEECYTVIGLSYGNKEGKITGEIVMVNTFVTIPAEELTYYRRH